MPTPPHTPWWPRCNDNNSLTSLAPWACSIVSRIAGAQVSGSRHRWDTAAPVSTITVNLTCMRLPAHRSAWWAINVPPRWRGTQCGCVATASPIGGVDADGMPLVVARRSRFVSEPGEPANDCQRNGTPCIFNGFLVKKEMPPHDERHLHMALTRDCSLLGSVQ